MWLALRATYLHEIVSTLRYISSVFSSASLTRRGVSNYSFCKALSLLLAQCKYSSQRRKEIPDANIASAKEPYTAFLHLPLADKKQQHQQQSERAMHKGTREKKTNTGPMAEREFFTLLGNFGFLPSTLPSHWKRTVKAWFSYDPTELCPHSTQPANSSPKSRFFIYNGVSRETHLLLVWWRNIQKSNSMHKFFFHWRHGEEPWDISAQGPTAVSTPDEASEHVFVSSHFYSTPAATYFCHHPLPAHKIPVSPSLLRIQTT